MRLPTISDLIADLQLAKQIAISNENANGLVLATMSQAKLLGLDKPIIDVTSSTTSEPIADYSQLTDDELRQLMALTEKTQQGSSSAKPLIIALAAPETDSNGKVTQ